MTAHLSLRKLEDTPALSLSEVKYRANRIVSSRTGIVSKVELKETGPCDPTVYWASATPADTTAAFGARASNDGNASALSVDAAVVKALGESIERYCVACADDSALRLSSLVDLDEPAVHPSAWALFKWDQLQAPGFPVPPFTEETRIRWARGFSLTKDASVYVPASFVHIPYKPVAGETRILPWQVSTGLACHTGLARASLKALLEVVERDAFMLFWHRQIRCPEIDVSNLSSSELCELVHRTQVLGYCASIRLLTLDIPVPVILVTFTSSEHKPYVVMGCAADCSPEVALRLALEEALLSLHGITTLAERDPLYAPDSDDYADITTLLKHPWVYAVDPRLRAVMSAQLVPSGNVPFSELPRGSSGSTLEQLSWLVARLHERNLEAIVVDLTTLDIDDVGFKVVRGMVPGMQPLDIDHRYRHLGGRRLYEPPSRLAVDEDRMGSDLNPYPHPFP